VVVVPLLDQSGLDRLREALASAGYTKAAVEARYHAVSHARDRLDTLIGVFLRGWSEPARSVAAALAPLGLDEAVAAGLVEPDGDRVRAAVWVYPYRDWWVVSDLPGFLRAGPKPPDHVIGISRVSTALVDATIRRPVRAALDIGTGSGVQALHLSGHADRVTTTDLSPRALRFAATTAALNGLDWELLCGDLATPVAGRRFDLVVANPPYIVGPGGEGYLYRDSGRPGDAISAELATAAPRLLEENGYLQYLANWTHVHGQDWTERLTEWVAGAGCDTWIVQHSVTEPDRYVTMWLAETGHDTDPARRAAWLDYFEANKIEGIGFGLITMRNTGKADPILRIEEHPDRLTGTQVLRWFDRQDWLRAHDPLRARFVTAPGVELTQHATRGDGGWRLERQTLTVAAERRAVEVDPLVAALVADCDGTRPLRDQVTALAASHQLDPDELTADLVPAVVHLIERGILISAE
jgi:hypothetical protein